MTNNPLFPNSLLERVREGMAVVDARGTRLGTVVRMRLGYPQAVSADADQDDVRPLGVVVGPVTGGTTGFGVATPLQPLLTGVDAPEMPDEVRLELLRAGYLEIDGPGVRGLARYIHGDQIADVSGKTVRLRPLP